ncbi:lipocalin [Salipiger sp. IMCC34102]|uniref:lipocalin family protein n=1 Tax=Salipiger sp. IMCC34102 TaxID=2510647 RepID=UPI00101D9061|nr:lipocalin family protein [Salipiger sp. IMCC34102]RYH01934.1 lipocalin [Salipiger sp. IMCC34102]
MRALVGILLLAGCAASDPAPVAEAPTRGFRDASVPVASAALFDPDRFAGDWQVVARYPDADDCAARSVSYARVTPTQLTLREDCADGSQRAGRARHAGPGRLQLSPDLGGGARWVLWVDEGYRTAVLADPQGTGAWILDRGAAIPPDRLAAARIVLDFNGFDLKPLQEVTP